MARRKIDLTDEEKNAIRIAKAELKEYRENIKYIDEKLDDIEEIKTRVLKVTATWSKTKTSQTNESNDKFADALSEIEELKEDSQEKLRELLVKKFEIDSKIESLPQPYRNVLFYRYTRCKRWSDVANELGYEEDSIYRIHREAVYFYSKIKSDQ